MGDEPLVVPGDADASPLWQQVKWNVEHVKESDLPDEPEMPTDEDLWLTARQLQIVRRWINNGAHKYCGPHACGSERLTEIDFPSARQCAHCHPNQYRDWSRSMHAYAQQSPVFEAFALS